MPTKSLPKALTATDTLAAELQKLGLSDQVVATWLLPIFAHLQALSRGLEIPDRLLALSRLVGVELGGEVEATNGE